MEDLSSSVPSAGRAPGARRQWLWAVAVVAIAALAAGGLWGWTVTQARSLAEARATAEIHWGAAFASLDTIATVTDRLAVTLPADAKTNMTAMASSLTAMKATATEELDAVSAAVSRLPASSEKSLHSIAIISARQAVAKAGDVAPALAVLPDFYTGATKVAAALQQARASVNASISDSNAEKWAPAASSARQALAECAAAETTLKRLEGLRASRPGITDTGDIAASLTQVRLERALARGALGIAQAGKGSTASYNKAVARYNKAGVAANGAKDPESLATPVIFAKATLDALRSAQTLVGDAHTRHDRALQQSLVTR